MRPKSKIDKVLTFLIFSITPLLFLMGGIMTYSVLKETAELKEYQKYEDLIILRKTHRFIDIFGN